MSKNKISPDVDEDPNLYYGTGEFTLPNGDAYKGQYCAHRYGLIWREGKGCYTTKDDQTYEGYWKDDKLIENTELSIHFPTGEKYYGCTAQDKYFGPGVYTMDNMMDVSCEFVNNKPIGTIVLSDINGRIWEGQAEENSSLLLPENLFYCNIPNDLGIGRLKPSLTQQDELEQESSQPKEASIISDRELERIIFAKTQKTLNDIDFAKSKWYQRYLRYRTMKDTITEKLKSFESDDDTEELTDEENKWYKKYVRHKSRQKAKKKQEAFVKKEALKTDTSLLQAFYSKGYKESFPPMKVIYPTSDWVDNLQTTGEKNENEEAEIALKTIELERKKPNSK